MHLSPRDLDTLSEVFVERVEDSTGSSCSLSDCLVRGVGGTENESGANLVDPDWVRMVAKAEEAAAPELAAEWLRRAGEMYGQRFPVSPKAVRAVQELIRLCRVATKENLDVVHAWYL
jgi:hypothetical protein